MNSLERLGQAVLLVAVLVAGDVIPALGQPLPGISRAIVISVDGLRSDALLRADAPAILGLMARGSFTMWAQTTAVAVTLPSHTSMLTGVPPSKHGVDWNSDLPFSKPLYPRRPTLFEVAQKSGYTTALAVGKSKLSVLAKPGTLSWQFIPDSSAISDRVVTDESVDLIREHAPQVMFVHLPGVDRAGHDHGWGSGDQLEAIGFADRCIARVLDALAERGVLDSTFVIVTTDHGGAGTTHGPDDPRSRCIPWIAAGAGVRRNHDLASEDGVDVRTEDTFATVCAVLGILVDQPIAGRAVTAIYDTTRTE